MTDHSPSRAFSDGESVFTTMRVVNGHAYFLAGHKERLQQSVAWLWPSQTSRFVTGWEETLSTLPEGSGVWRVALSVRPDLQFQVSELCTDPWTFCVQP